MSRKITLTTAFAVLMLLQASLAHAQYDLSWFTIDGGGLMSSTGGNYSLAGTIGQPDAGTFTSPMAGGTFELVGGFWVSAPACACPGDVNGDGFRNGSDIQVFVGCLTLGGACSCADTDLTGGVSLNDVAPFVTALLTTPTCP